MHRVLFGLFALAACLQGGLAKIETDQDVLVLTEANFDEAIKVRAVCCGCRVRAAACGEGWGGRSGHCSASLGDRLPPFESAEPTERHRAWRWVNEHMPPGATKPSPCALPARGARAAVRTALPVMTAEPGQV